jgi:hypothetical protein
MVFDVLLKATITDLLLGANGPDVLLKAMVPPGA